MLPVILQAESHVPLYVQLRDQIRALVHSGELRAGDRIPASRELACQLGVHRTTVANAYAELDAEGLIRGHVGRGTFICGKPARPADPPARPATYGGAMRWESAFADERGDEALSRLMPEVPAGAIAFTAAHAPEEFYPVEEFRRCLNAVLRREGRRILQLGSSDGYGPLKDALLDLLRSENLPVRPGQLLITGGCQQAIDLVCKAFLRPGDTIALENPVYPGAISIFAAARVRMLPIPVETDSSRTGETGLNEDALEAALLQDRVKLIFVTPDFHNPTGTALPLAGRRRLLELAARYQVPVIEDGIYARLRLRGASLPSLKALDTAGNVIQIDSFSKVAFPGLRVGWCVGPETAIERLRLVKQASDLHTDQLSQAAMAEFIRRGLLARHLERMKRIFRGRLEAMEWALAKYMPSSASWTRADGGMTLWLTLPPGFDAADLLIHARERGIFFLPGRHFYPQHPRSNTLRLCFASVDEKRIRRGIEIFCELLKREMRKHQHSARTEEPARVALI